MFFVDPDIRLAETPPGEFYTSEEIFEKAKNQIFARTWQLIAGPECVPGLTPVTLLPEYIGEELIVSMSANGEVRCLSNVCTHRGMLLIERHCAPELIRCPYHGRRFALDGTFLTMPEFSGVVNFPSERDNLAKIPSYKIGDFIFVSLDPACPAEESLESARELLSEPEARELQLTGRREYTVRANWALYCENYLEGFHIPFVHRSLNEALDFSNYRTDLSRFSVLQTAFDRAGDLAARYLFVFPNFMLNLYPGGLSVNIVRPVTIDKTIVEYRTYVNPSGKFALGADSDLDTVEIEDERIVEAVNRGVRSRSYRRGRYSPSQERGVHHFHRLISEFLELG
jgi:choline monooxygenase